MWPRRGAFWLSLLSVCWLSACTTPRASAYEHPGGLAAGPTIDVPTTSASTQFATRPTFAPGSQGAAKPSPSASRQPAPSPRSTSTPAGTPTPLPDINPLTGLIAPEPALLNRRPLAVKISNYPRDIRPQFGLNEADVVFEYYIEWGYTRFIGIFYGQDATRIGPVRSGRYFDEHITRMYQAFYVFNFADPREYRYFLGGDLASSMVVPGGNCSVAPFFTSRGSSVTGDASHFECYFDSTRFDEYIQRRNYDNSTPELRATLFTAEAPPGGVVVDRIFTYYSRCDYNYWEYDPGAARYLRFQEAPRTKDKSRINDCVDDPQTYAPLVDALDEDQVFTDNLVVLYASHSFGNENEQSDEIYHIDIIDSGRAYVFRDGLAIPARWVRTDIEQPLVLVGLNGDPLGLAPGRTFFEVIGETSDGWSDGADWHFDFHTP